MLLCLIAAYFLADFISGVYHWIEQRFFGEKWPIIGRWIDKPNGTHHDDPAAFLHQSYWARNWISMIAALVVGVLLALCGAPWWVLLGVAISSQANEVHAWAHRKAPCRAVRGLQEFGLLQSPRHHAGHHKPPHTVRFCVITDWINPVLDGLRIWRALEWLAGQLFGLEVYDPVAQRTKAQACLHGGSC